MFFVLSCCEIADLNGFGVMAEAIVDTVGRKRSRTFLIFILLFSFLHFPPNKKPNSIQRNYTGFCDENQTIERSIMKEKPRRTGVLYYFHPFVEAACQRQIFRSYLSFPFISADSRSLSHISVLISQAPSSPTSIAPHENHHVEGILIEPSWPVVPSN